MIHHTVTTCGGHWKLCEVNSVLAHKMSGLATLVLSMVNTTPSGVRVCACARVALIIQHATRRHIVICSHFGSSAFLTLRHKRHNFLEKVTEHKMYVLISSTTFFWNVSHSKKNSERYCHKCEKYSFKVPVILVVFWSNSSFSTDFRQKVQISSLMNIRPMEPELFHADGRTDMTKLIVAFRNLANAP